jgi:hypothetical protein
MVKLIYRTVGTASRFGPKSKSRLARLGAISNTVKITKLLIRPPVFAVSMGLRAYFRVQLRGRVPAVLLVVEDSALINWTSLVCAV